MVQDEPDDIESAAENKPRPLTLAEAQQLFEAVAAKGDEIAFRWLAEGCECRAQLMIEYIQAMGVTPGRVWALSVGRDLLGVNPDNPRQTFSWLNHVAPTIKVQGVDHDLMVIDPSLCQNAPMTLPEWAAAMQIRYYEVSKVGLAQADIMDRQRTLALQGIELDAMLFVLELGEPPIPEMGGSGFHIAPDPPEGASAFAHVQMKYLLEKQRHQLHSDTP